MKAKTVRVLHMCADKKGLILRLVRDYSHGQDITWVCPNIPLFVDKLIALAKYPKDFIVMDPSCNRRTKEGRCAGHREKVEEP